MVGDYLDEPVLIIKTAWGGHDLGIKFRPPSSGQPAYEKTKVKEEDIGSSYRKMMETVKDVTENLGNPFPRARGP